MIAKQYRKRPVVVEAIQWKGGEKSLQDVANFMGVSTETISPGYRYITIKTLEGDMKADQKDWVIKGVNGEFYPCKPDIFKKTYERV